MLGEAVPVEVGPARGSTNASAPVGHRLGAELADEADHAGAAAGARSARSPISPWCQPSQRWLSVPSSCGQVGQHAAVGDDRPGRVGLLERPLHPAVEHRACSTTAAAGAAKRRSRPSRPSALDLRGVGDRLVVGAPLRRSTGGGRAASTASRAWRTASRRIVAAVAPLQREVLQQQHAELVGGLVQLGAGDVGVHPQRVEPGLDGELDVAAHLGRRGVGQRRAASAAGWRP